jgi:hypothetical protein
MSGDRCHACGVTDVTLFVAQMRNCTPPKRIHTVADGDDEFDIALEQQTAKPE